MAFTPDTQQRIVNTGQLANQIVTKIERDTGVPVNRVPHHTDLLTAAIKVIVLIIAFLIIRSGISSGKPSIIVIFVGLILLGVFIIYPLLKGQLSGFNLLMHPFSVVALFLLVFAYMDIYVKPTASTEKLRFYSLVAIVFIIGFVVFIAPIFSGKVTAERVLKHPWVLGLIVLWFAIWLLPFINRIFFKIPSPPEISAVLLILAMYFFIKPIMGLPYGLHRVIPVMCLLLFFNTGGDFFTKASLFFFVIITFPLWFALGALVLMFFFDKYLQINFGVGLSDFGLSLVGINWIYRIFSIVTVLGVIALIIAMIFLGPAILTTLFDLIRLWDYIRPIIALGIIAGLVWHGSISFHLLKNIGINPTLSFIFFSIAAYTIHLFTYRPSARTPRAVI